MISTKNPGGIFESTSTGEVVVVTASVVTDLLSLGFLEDSVVGG